MEYINKIELKGIVGSVIHSKVADSSCTRFSVFTEYSNRLSSGDIVVDTQWHNCVTFLEEADSIKKDDTVHLFGRLKYQKYIDAEGNLKTINEIIVNKIHIC